MKTNIFKQFLKQIFVPGAHQSIFLLVSIQVLAESLIKNWRVFENQIDNTSRFCRNCRQTDCRRERVFEPVRVIRVSSSDLTNLKRQNTTFPSRPSVEA